MMPSKEKLAGAIAIEAAIGMIILSSFASNSPEMFALLLVEVGSWIVFHKYHDNFADWRLS